MHREKTPCKDTYTETVMSFQLVRKLRQILNRISIHQSSNIIILLSMGMSGATRISNPLLGCNVVIK